MSDARRSGLWMGLDTLLFYAGLALFGIMCLAWSLPAGLLAAVLPRRMGAPVGQFGINLDSVSGTNNTATMTAVLTPSAIVSLLQ